MRRFSPLRGKDVYKRQVYDIREAYVKQLVKKRSEKVYFLAETSKCSQVDFYRAFSLDGCVLINEYTSEEEIADPV